MVNKDRGNINPSYPLFVGAFRDALVSLKLRRGYTAEHLARLVGIPAKTVEKHLSSDCDALPQGPHLHRYLAFFGAELVLLWLAPMGIHAESAGSDRLRRQKEAKQLLSRLSSLIGEDGA
ncbi:MAG: hypothetical protein K2Q12_07965 [Rickettsiales bacterium]|nr:hypothetical protein [Rickettsiales bacterium]